MLECPSDWIDEARRGARRFDGAHRTPSGYVFGRLTPHLLAGRHAAAWRTVMRWAYPWRPVDNPLALRVYQVQVL